MAEVSPPDLSERFSAAIAAIDRENALDPEQLRHGDEHGPKELLHARMVTDWVRRIDPDAGEAQLIAARAHHFRRWASPRSAYPDGRAGYLSWRRAAARRHAEEVAALLAANGYDDETIERVGQIIRKEHRSTDPQVQTHEDALCLVFLETQLEAVADRLGVEAAVPVLVRTLDKMSDTAIEAAARLPLGDAVAALLEPALADRARRGVGRGAVG